MADASPGESRQFDYDTGGGTDLVEVSGIVFPASGGSVATGGVLESGTSAVGALAVGGGTPHDSVDSGNPLKLGGYAKATVPTSVSADGDRVNAWFLLNGIQNVRLVDSSGVALPGGTQYVGDAAATATPTGTIDMGLANAAAPSDVSANNDAVAMWALRNGSQVVNLASGGTLIAAVALGDAAANPTPISFGSFLMGYNGSTWDRVRTANTGRLQVDVITGGGAGTQYVGDAAATATPTGGMGMALANAAAPTDVSANNDAVALWALRNGSLVVNLAVGGTLLTNMGQAAASANFVRLSDGTLTVGAVDETGVSAVDALAVGGGTPHDSVDSGNPVKIGGKAVTAIPALVASNDRVNAWFNVSGQLMVSDIVKVDTIGTDGANLAQKIGLDGAFTTAVPASALYGFSATGWDRLKTIEAITAQGTPNIDRGILSVGVGPGWDRKRDPAGVPANSTASAVTVVIDGATTVSFHVTTIGTTPGSMVFEITGDDTNWQAVVAYKVGTGWNAASTFVPAVNDVYVVPTIGARQVRYRVNAVYASGTATVKVTSSYAPFNLNTALTNGTGTPLGTLFPANDSESNGPAYGALAVASHTMMLEGAVWVRGRSLASVVSGVTNVDTGITPTGVGPGYDRKRDPAGVAATNTANAVTAAVDGADVMAFHVTAIGTTPGSMIIETTNDDGAWVTAGYVIKLSTGPDVRIEGSFVPAVNDVYLVRTTGHRQVRYRVNAVYASGTATVKITSSQGTAMIKSIDMPAPPHNIGYAVLGVSAQYTTAQTSTTIGPTVAAGQRMVVTYIQIQAGGTVAGTQVSVYFGTGAFSRGTSKTIFDGEFAPSATSKPGFAASPPVPWIGAADEELKITNVGAINPLTVTIWYYLVAA